MSARPSALSLSLAVLAVVAALALAVRLGAQLGALNGVNGDLADAQRTAAELDQTLAQGLGPPLLDAGAGPAEAALGQRLQGLGIAVTKSALVAATPAGRGLAVGRFQVEGAADPAALDRLSRWGEANARSAILESLTATAREGGKSDVRIELDALVRDLKAPAR